MVIVRRPQLASWRQAGMAVFGALLLILGLACLSLSIADLRLLAHADGYIDAELEIVKYHKIVDEGRREYRDRKGRRRTESGSRRSRIEGVIHPGGVKVETDDHDIQLSILDRSDAVVAAAPLRAEVEGQRVPVLYWPESSGPRPWLAPPEILTAVRPTPVGAVKVVSFCAAFLAGALACFRYARDPAVARQQRLEERGPSAWPPWTTLCVSGALLTWPVFLLAAVVMRQGFKLNRTATARIPWTTYEWTLASAGIVLAALAPIACTIGLYFAVRHRLRNNGQA